MPSQRPRRAPARSATNLRMSFEASSLKTAQNCSEALRADECVNEVPTEPEGDGKRDEGVTHSAALIALRRARHTQSSTAKPPRPRARKTRSSMTKRSCAWAGGFLDARHRQANPMWNYEAGYKVVIKMRPAQEVRCTLYFLDRAAVSRRAPDDFAPDLWLAHCTWCYNASSRPWPLKRHWQNPDPVMTAEEL